MTEAGTHGRTVRPVRPVPTRPGEPSGRGVRGVLARRSNTSEGSTPTGPCAAGRHEGGPHGLPAPLPVHRPDPARGARCRRCPHRRRHARTREPAAGRKEPFQGQLAADRAPLLGPRATSRRAKAHSPEHGCTESPKRSVTAAVGELAGTDGSAAQRSLRSTGVEILSQPAHGSPAALEYSLPTGCWPSRRPCSGVHAGSHRIARCQISALVHHPSGSPRQTIHLSPSLPMLVAAGLSRYRGCRLRPRRTRSLGWRRLAARSSSMAMRATIRLLTTVPISSRRPSNAPTPSATRIGSTSRSPGLTGVHHRVEQRLGQVGGPRNRRPRLSAFGPRGRSTRYPGMRTPDSCLSWSDACSAPTTRPLNRPRPIGSQQAHRGRRCCRRSGAGATCLLVGSCGW